MEEIHFKVIKQKETSIEFPNNMMLKYPVYEHYLFEITELVLIYKYDPTKITKEHLESYLEQMKQFLKEKYNAISVSVVQTIIPDQENLIYSDIKQQ